jgi:hypothetical protein
MDETYQKRMERARLFRARRFDWDGFRLGGGYLTDGKILRLLDALTLGIGDDVDFDSAAKDGIARSRPTLRRVTASCTSGARSPT